jgi:Transglutaminase-like superfamily
MTRILILKIHIRLLIWLIPLLVRCMPFQTLIRFLTPSGRYCPYRKVPAETIAQVIQQALSNPRWMKRRACLRLGLTTGYFLGLGGYPAVLHFALAPPNINPKRLHGHCWVTLNDVPVTAPPEKEVAMKTVFTFPVDRKLWQR